MSTAEYVPTAPIDAQIVSDTLQQLGMNIDEQADLSSFIERELLGEGGVFGDLGERQQSTDEDNEQHRNHQYRKKRIMKKQVYDDHPKNTEDNASVEDPAVSRLLNASEALLMEANVSAADREQEGEEHDDVTATGCSSVHVDDDVASSSAGGGTAARRASTLSNTVEGIDIPQVERRLREREEDQSDREGRGAATYHQVVKTKQKEVCHDDRQHGTATQYHHLEQRHEYHKAAAAAASNDEDFYSELQRQLDSVDEKRNKRDADRWHERRLGEVEDLIREFEGRHDEEERGHETRRNNRWNRSSQRSSSREACDDDDLSSHLVEEHSYTADGMASGYSEDEYDIGAHHRHHERTSSSKLQNVRPIDPSARLLQPTFSSAHRQRGETYHAPGCEYGLHPQRRQVRQHQAARQRSSMERHQDAMADILNHLHDEDEETNNNLHGDPSLRGLIPPPLPEVEDTYDAHRLRNDGADAYTMQKLRHEHKYDPLLVYRREEQFARKNGALPSSSPLSYSHEYSRMSTSNIAERARTSHASTRMVSVPTVPLRSTIGQPGVPRSGGASRLAAHRSFLKPAGSTLPRGAKTDIVKKQQSYAKAWKAHGL